MSQKKLGSVLLLALPLSFGPLGICGKILIANGANANARGILGSHSREFIPPVSQLIGAKATGLTSNAIFMLSLS